MAPTAVELESEVALRASAIAAKHGVDLSKLPKIIDISPESITGNVIALNSNSQDERMKFVFENLITHLHDFIRETSLTTDEWMAAIEFLTATGHKSSDIRQEFILLSDVLGASALVDSINNKKPAGVTEATVLGPFYTEDAHDLQNGSSIASEGKGEYMLVEGRVLDTKGNPIAGAVIDTWETDSEGLYDNQYPNRTEPDCRGRLSTADDGTYAFRAVVPVPYPIPTDGPVGELLSGLERHAYRPAHLHIMIKAPGFETLVTALYFKGDPYLTSDPVFGVKSSLIVSTETITDTAVTKSRGFRDAKSHELLKQDFVLATVDEAVSARKASK